MIEEVDELRRALREESAMLNWLIRCSDPVELFGPEGLQDWGTDDELNWRMAIRKAMGDDGKAPWD